MCVTVLYLKPSSLPTSSSVTPPQAWVVVEEDTVCVAKAMDEIQSFIRSAPSDWDMCVMFSRFDLLTCIRSLSVVCAAAIRIYLGGKYFTFWGRSDVKYENHQGRVAGPFMHSVCLGERGSGDSPLAPDVSRQILLNDSYWQTLETTNTHAIVYNPLRMERILPIIQPEGAVGSPEPPRPFDVKLADAMRFKLRGRCCCCATVQYHNDPDDPGSFAAVYTPPRPICVQPAEMPRGTLKLRDITHPFRHEIFSSPLASIGCTIMWLSDKNSTGSALCTLETCVPRMLSTTPDEGFDTRSGCFCGHWIRSRLGSVLWGSEWCLLKYFSWRGMASRSALCACSMVACSSRLATNWPTGVVGVGSRSERAGRECAVRMRRSLSPR